MKSPAQRAFLYAKLENKKSAVKDKAEPKKKGLKALVEKAELKKPIKK